jgi:hypothetical protein
MSKLVKEFLGKKKQTGFYSAMMPVRHKAGAVKIKPAQLQLHCSCGVKGCEKVRGFDY